MVTRRSMLSQLTLVLAVALAMIVAGPAAAQGRPPAPLGRDITTGKGDFTQEQKDRIKEYVEYFCTQMTAKDAASEVVEQARAELSRPLASINNPSDPFKFEYSSRLVDCLRTSIGNLSLHATTNAIGVLSLLGTRGALDLVIETSRNANLDWQARLAAAKASIDMIKSPSLSPKEVIERVHRLNEASKDEKNTTILRYRFEAMIAAAENPKLAPDDRQKIRCNDLVDSMNAAVDRIGQPISDTFGALHVAVYRIWRLLLENQLSPDEIQCIGKGLSPALVKALDLARQQWVAAHADPQLAVEYSTFVKGCEDFLKRMDPYIRQGAGSPQTSLQDAWDGKKKEQFDADTQKWMDVVSKPPYGKK